MGVMQYHVYRLERDRTVVSVRHGLYKRYYADLGLRMEEREILNVLSQETERDLVLYLIKNPQATQKKLSEFARISASSTNWHMKRLSKAGFVEARRSGGVGVSFAGGGAGKGVFLFLYSEYRKREKWVGRVAVRLL